jgi:CHAT domain-containing protein
VEVTEYSARRQVPARSLADVQQRLAPHAVLLSYFVASTKSLLFVARRDSFEMLTLDAGRDELRDAVRRFRAFSDPLGGDPDLEDLHRMLVKTMLERRLLVAADSVIVVPHGPLHYLPFAALTDGKTTFGSDHVISYLPGADLVGAPSRPAQPLVARVFAHSREGSDLLVHAEEEAAAVGKTYGVVPAMASSSTESRLREAMTQAHVVHVAAHAMLNSAQPNFSRLLLAADGEHDGLVNVHELYGLDMGQLDLVVLSACHTQIGPLSAGDDVVGLHRAFLQAGAKSVIASLWPVDDESSALLMSRFHVLLRAGRGKAKALAEAQREVRKQFPNARDWAAFVLNGDAGVDTAQGRLSGMPQASRSPAAP